MAPMATGGGSSGGGPTGGGPRDPRVTLDEIVEAQISVVTATFNNAAAYTNLIMLAGYAGFFGLWQLTAEYLSKNQKLWSALLILISLLLFVIFEVVKMVVITHGVRKKAEVLNSPNTAGSPERTLVALQALEKALDRSTKPFMLYWAITTGLCVATGLGGVAILSSAFICSLMQ